MLKRIRNTLSFRWTRKDAGWTLIEATISVVLISLIFLAFTISILAFREWTTRSWALRTMDQYAGDFVTYVDSLTQIGKRIVRNPDRYGMQSFTVEVLQFTPYSWLPIETVRYNFSAHPSDLISISVGNAAPKEFYSFISRGEESFPPDNWEEKHIFTLSAFEFDYWPDPYQSQKFDSSMVTVSFELEYQRPREVEDLEGETKREYELHKRYTKSFFMKNYLETID